MDDGGREGHSWVYDKREREEKQKEKLKERKSREKSLVV